MDRRNFFKLVGTASGAAVTGACGSAAREIIPLLVPEKEIVPGIEEWHPSVCRECSAGCGTIVRVMQGERLIEVAGEKVRQSIAAIKKIEGNPLDPVSGGRLCARGQASIQSLYHPDRLRGPQKRSGERGSGQLEAVSWEDAMAQAGEAVAKAVSDNPRGIVYLARPQTGTRSATVARFLEALGAAPAQTVGLGDFAVERRAAAAVFGWDGPPNYEIQDATYVLGIGADFLGGWVSPVYYARRFGHFRRGRPGLRGRLVHAESRFSQTAWSADQWLPVRPGGEHALALAIGHLLVAEKWAPGLESVSPTLREAFAAVDLDRALEIAGLELRPIRRITQELASATAPLVVAGASVVQRNSFDAVVAANALNLLLGNVGAKGGVLPPASLPLESFGAARPQTGNLMERLGGANLVLLDGADPVYAFPAATALIEKAPAILSFSSFLDDSSAYADLILPDHSPLEAASAVVPDIAPGRALTGARAFVAPLGDTRSTEQLLVDLAKAAGKSMEMVSPESSFKQIFAEYGSKDPDWTGADEFVTHAQRQGGWWADQPLPPAKSTVATKSAPAGADLSLGVVEPQQLEGSPDQYPQLFQPYPSVQFGEGSGANLPWLQELPDPTSSAMWGLPVEIDPKTAGQLGVVNGDLVRVTSSQGQLEAPAYVHPAAIPGVVSMAIGQGHRHYGRYAAGRGSNPLALVAAVFESESGALAFGATRVRLEKVGKRGRLVQFATVDHEPHFERR
jgi:anaerobic selenocysteine-containing dehydrogenase